ncbi:MAG: MCE family protein [Campylobacteraceae bacterium]|nr:MCE family protein [Campylobacteraceae bacterium]
MENKVSYTIVGLFVLSLLIGIILFVLWLTRYNLDNENIKYYKIYAKESISGLEKNSLVTYKGIDIGQVQKVNIDKNNIEQIEISIYVSDYRMVKENSFAIIQSKGISGNKFIEIVGGTNDSKTLAINENGFGIIPVKLSFVDELSSSAEKMTGKFESILTKIDTLINEKTINNINGIFNNINKSTQHLYHEQMSFDILLEKMNSLLSKQNTKSINESIINVKKISDKMNDIIENDVKKVLRDVNKSINNINSNSLNFNTSLNKFEDLMLNIDYKINDFSDNAGKIFQVRELKYGPGEIK